MKWLGYSTGNGELEITSCVSEHESTKMTGMPSRAFTLVDSQIALESALQGITPAAIAVDIETINWWDRAKEKVALVQLAYRDDGEIRVLIIDAMSPIDLTPLRALLESPSVLKVIHNASYDAIKLARHHDIHTTPIHDTMLAARRSGERRWSLKAQVQAHLGISLDKREQRGDWGRRPLLDEQLQYAALDASCTLDLYELQVSRGLRGEYALKSRRVESTPLLREVVFEEVDLVAHSAALLGIVVELSGRYSPEQLSASVGSDRVGLAGWIVDRMIGREADIEEGIARDEIARLCEDGMIVINQTRRLEATDRGREQWERTP
jgi:hypothetical protein